MEKTFHPLPADLMSQLARPFQLHEHDIREQSKKVGDKYTVTGYLTYVPIDQVIKRLNEVLGPWWSEEIVQVTMTGDPSKPMVLVQVRITYQDGGGQVWYRDGLGAGQFNSSSADLDQVVKTAQAEALKKAANQFGIGAYLWDRPIADEIARLLLVRRGSMWASTARKPARFMTAMPDWLKDMREIAAGRRNSGAIHSQPSTDDCSRLAWRELNGAIRAELPEVSQRVRREVTRLLLERECGTDMDPHSIDPKQLTSLASELRSGSKGLQGLARKMSSLPGD